jgi:hypothetical protein
MPKQILPTLKTDDAKIAIAVGFPQRIAKQVRQDCAHSARSLELRTPDAPDPTGAALQAHRNLQIARAAVSQLQDQLDALRTVKGILTGEDYEPLDHPLVGTAEELRICSIESKAIDPTSGLTDLTTLI